MLHPLPWLGQLAHSHPSQGRPMLRRMEFVVGLISVCLGLWRLLVGLSYFGWIAIRIPDTPDDWPGSKVAAEGSSD
jgi:hypothetical protein